MEEPVGCSPSGRYESDMTERLHFHFSLSRIGEGNGNPLQCSCLENPRDRGAWWAAVCGVTQGQTLLKWFSSSIVINFLVLSLFYKSNNIINMYCKFCFSLTSYLQVFKVYSSFLLSTALFLKFILQKFDSDSFLIIIFLFYMLFLFHNHPSKIVYLA